VSVTEPVQIPIEGDAKDFIADAKKVQADMDALAAKLKAAGVSQSAYNAAVAKSNAEMKAQAAVAKAQQAELDKLEKESIQAAVAAEKMAVAEAKNSAAMDKQQKEAAESAAAQAKLVQSVKVTSFSLTDLRSSYQMVMDVTRAAGRVWNATGQEFVNYAEQVKNMSRSIGTSAEETSRLIQVADDVRVSYDTMKIAMKEAQKDGVEPNIEGLAKLSDQYLALAPGVERTKFLLDKFGKSGMEMGKLMEMGGKGIRSASDAVNDSLIITEKGIQASDEYQNALDDFNDSILALKISIGKELLPVMTDLMEHTQLHTRALEIMKEKGLSTYHAMGTVGYAAAYKQADGELKIEKAANAAASALDNETGATYDNKDAVATQKEAVDKATKALKDYKDMLDEASQAQQDMESASREIADFQKGYDEDHKNAVEDLKDAQRELQEITAEQGDGSREQARALEDVRFAQKDLNEAIKQYGKNSEEATMARRKLEDAMDATGKGGEAILEAENAVRDAEAAVNDLQASWHEASNNMIYDMVLVGLSVDGLLESERKAADEYAIKLGIKTQADVDEANRRKEIADATIAGILQSEDVMNEQMKIDAKTKELTVAEAAAKEQAAAEETTAAIVKGSAVSVDAINNVARSIDSATLSYYEMAAAAKKAADAAPTTSGSSPGGGSTNRPSSSVMHSRDNGGVGIAGQTYWIGTGAQPERFTAPTNGVFTPNTKNGMGNNVTYNIVINNPKPGSAENDIRNALRNLQYTGEASL